MSEWKNFCLGDVVEFNPAEKIVKGTLAKKIAMEKLQPFCRTVTGYEVEKYNGGVKFRNDDTIMARITPCLENGKTAKVAVLDDGEIGFGSTEYIVFRAKKNLTVPDFVYYLIRSEVVREPAIKSMVGTSGRQRVQTDYVRNIVINLPPLDTQKKIAAVLSALDDKIELNNAINKNLEKQAQAIYKNMFVDNLNPAWKKGTLSDIAEITMGQSPSGKSYNDTGKGMIFFQGRTDFGFRFPTIRMFTTEPKRIAKKGDILLSVRAPVGDYNVATDNCCIGRGLASIYSKQNNSSFLLYTILHLKGAFDVFNGQGTVFGAINQRELKNIEVVVPEQSLINEFEKIVAPMDSIILNNCFETKKLGDVRDALLPRLMSGEIDVSKVEIFNEQ